MDPRSVARSGAALVICLASLAVGVVALEPAAAHAPHDDVAQIDLPSDFADRGIAHAVVRGRLMRSEDRGETWNEVIRGLGGESSRVRSVASAPGDPAVVYLTASDAGALRSTDGGQSFEPTGLDRDVGFVTVSPTNSDEVIAGGRLVPTLFRSVDAGATWAPLADQGQPISAFVAAFYGDGTLVVADRSGEMHTSDDGGDTWRGPFVLPGREPIRSLDVVEVGDEEILVVGTADGAVYRSDDGAGSFTALGAGLPDEAVNSVSVSQTEGASTWWASSATTGPHRLLDEGGAWQRFDEGLTTSVQAQDVGVSDWRTIAAAPDDTGMVLLAGFDGLFRLADASTDRWVEIQTLTGYVAGLAVSPDFADDERVIVSSYVKGSFVSEDGGDSWHIANDGLTVDEIGEGNRFAPLRRLHNVVFSPDFADDDTVFGANWVRFLRSTDGGVSWEEIQVGPLPPEPLLRQFVIAVSPDYAEDATVYVGTRQGEIWRSSMRGDAETWELVSMVPGRVRSIALSPAYTDDRTIYVGTVEGAFVSYDAGRSWTATGVKNAAEPTGDEIDFAVQVAVSPDYARDATAAAATDNGLFVTRDAGQSWDRVATDAVPADGAIEAMAFSPAYADDGTFLVSVRNAGLARTNDEMRTFEAVAPDLLERQSLVSDFANPTSAPIQFSPDYAEDRTIFAYAQQEVLRSTDGGDTWVALELPSDQEVMASLAADEPAVASTSTSAVGPTTTVADDAAAAGGGAPAGDGDDSSAGTVVLAVLLVALLLAGSAVVIARDRHRAN